MQTTSVSNVLLWWYIGFTRRSSPNINSPKQSMMEHRNPCFKVKEHTNKWASDSFFYDLWYPLERNFQFQITSLQSKVFFVSTVLSHSLPFRELCRGLLSIRSHWNFKGFLPGRVGDFCIIHPFIDNYHSQYNKDINNLKHIRITNNYIYTKTLHSRKRRCTAR